MVSAAQNVPAESDKLCEKCGYVLNGLPSDSNCPECGQPIAESDAVLRAPPDWEAPERAEPIRRFLRTTTEVIFRPTRFFRAFATRKPRTDSRRFARIHWIIASVFFGAAAAGHLLSTVFIPPTIPAGVLLLIGSSVAIYAFLWGLTWVAAWLTNWEATYRGYRLPLDTVRRGMDYHAAHYLPVAMLFAATVDAYAVLFGRHVIDVSSTITYLYVVCIEVVIGAIYLFVTYWTAMRNMMYANG